jgi:putative two-component system response regulator
MQTTGTVIVADDAQGNIDLMSRILGKEGYTVLPAHDGAEALDLVLTTSPDIVLSDVMMPKLSGFELCRRLKQESATRLIPIVLVTSLNGAKERIEGIQSGADDFLTKPINAQELTARVKSLVRLKRFTDDLDSAESIIMSLAMTVEARDPYTGGHCARMASYSTVFGQELGFSVEEVAALSRGGFMHDVGKVGVPDAILLKPGKLTDSEFATMKQHTVIGDRLCGDLRVLRPVRPIVRWHHERLNGSGYPDGLRGDQIPLLAQVLAIVDVYDALTTARPYREALTPEVAEAELEREAARGLHQVELVRRFVELSRSGQLAQRVRRQSDRPGLQS